MFLCAVLEIGLRFFIFIKEVKEMPQYEEMYHKLFNAVTDAIEALKTAQKEVEDMYIKNEDEKSE